MCCALLTLPSAAFSQTDITQQPSAPADKNPPDTNQANKNQSDNKQADKKQETPKLEDAALHVISDKMIAKRETSMVEFIGNVKATRLDSIVHADAIQVFFHGDNSKKKIPRTMLKKLFPLGM